MEIPEYFHPRQSDGLLGFSSLTAKKEMVETQRKDEDFFAAEVVKQDLSLARPVCFVCFKIFFQRKVFLSTVSLWGLMLNQYRFM